MLEGLRAIPGIEIIICHSPVWEGIEDKTQIHGWRERLSRAWRWVSAYPSLIYRYMRLPRHDLVMVLYMGHFDVPVLWPFARLRRVPVLWHALISLHNSMVNERHYFRARHPAAMLLYANEWLACRAVAGFITNTQQASRYMTSSYGVPGDKGKGIFEGVELAKFPRRDLRGVPPDGPVRVLFYGTLIPFHGIEYVLEAVRLSQDLDIEWQLIGTGHESWRIDQFIKQYNPSNLSWQPWVPYAELHQHIHRADIGLGVFGESHQGRWVLPNKVYQMLACGIPVITRDSPGARELLSPGDPGIFLVSPQNPQAILDAIQRYVASRAELSAGPLHAELVRQFDVPARALALQSFIESIVMRRP